MTITLGMPQRTGQPANEPPLQLPPTAAPDHSRNKHGFWLSPVALIVGVLSGISFYLFVTLSPAEQLLIKSDQLILFHVLSIAAVLLLVVGVAHWEYGRLEKSRRHAEQSASNTHDFLQGILDASFDAVISVDAEQNITYFSRQAEVMFGYKAEEIIGKSLNLLIPTPSRRRHKEFAKNFTDGAEAARTMGKWRIVPGLTKDGREISTITRIVRHRDLNGAPMATATVRDVTELEKREILLSRTLAEVARSDKRLRAFFAQFTHELRTPLNAVVGFSELSLHHAQEGRHDQAEEYMRYIVDAGLRLSKLIDSVLEYRRIDDVFDDSNSEEVNIIDIFQSIAKRINRQEEEDVLTLKAATTTFSVFGIPEMIESYFEVFLELFTSRSKEPRILHLDVEGESVVIRDMGGAQASALTSIFHDLDRLNNLNFDDVIRSSESMDMRLFSLWKLADVCQISCEISAATPSELKLTFGSARQAVVYREEDGSVDDAAPFKAAKQAKTTRRMRQNLQKSA